MRAVRMLTIIVAVGVIAVAGAGRTDATSAVEVTRENLKGASLARPRVPFQGRLESQLAAVARRHSAGGERAALVAARAASLDVVDERVRVVVQARPGMVHAAEASVEGLGGEAAASYRSLVEALVPPGALERLSRADGIELVRPPASMRAEAVTSEGVAAANVSAWRSSGLTGAGVKVAVIDIGFAGSLDAGLVDELPSVTTKDFLCGGNFLGGSPHGTAVAEIVHDVAPAAQLYLVCVTSEVTLGNAVEYLQAEGVRIVNHSVSWFNTGRGDGTGAAGTPSEIVADARVNGILWVNAAGNEAENHWGGQLADADGDDLLEFAPGDEGNTILIPSSETVCVSLKWDDWPVTSEDFDLFIARSDDGEIVAESYADQSNGPAAPTEGACYTNYGPPDLFAFFVARYSAVGLPRFDLYYDGAEPLEHTVAAGSVTEPSSSPFALAVGGACWETGELELYSSQGPTVDGRRKPDLVAPASVSTSAYAFGTSAGCFSGFVGTSSSAPHVAGAAALVQQWRPLSTPAGIQAVLEAAAVDVGAPGKDSSTGAGRLWLPELLRESPIAFVRNDDIYVLNADGTLAAPLTSSGQSARDWQPSFSPDGTKIVFASNRDTGVYDEIYVMNADGSGATRLTTNDPYIHDAMPAFSPDGQKIVFSSSRDGGPLELYLMNADGSGQTRLTTSQPGTSANVSPSFSPDGTKVVFESSRPGIDIYLLDLATGVETRLTDDPADDTSPVFSPDGAKIAFVSRRVVGTSGGLPDVYVMDADGLNETRLTDEPRIDQDPAFSADGSQIVFASDRDGYLTELYVMGADGTAPTRLTSNTFSDDQPSWGPTAVLPAPVAAAAPTLDGTAVVGQALTTTVGDWISASPPSYSVQWLACSGAGDACDPIPGATDVMFVPSSGDAGATVRSQVTAEIGAEAVVTTSAASAVIQAARPVNTSLPVIAGTAQAGGTLTVAAAGAWTGAPATTSIQWRQCDEGGGGCVDIPAATAASYAVPPGAVGSTIRVTVKAMNPGGTGVGTSRATAPITAAGPPSGGGGGGGSGGGGGAADLVLTGTVEPSTAPVGAGLTWRLRLATKGALALGAYVEVALPTGVRLDGTQADRGPGCATTGAGRLRCNLDFVSPAAPAGNITLFTTVQAAGEHVLSANGGYAGVDPTPADNGVTLRATTPAAAPPLAPKPAGVTRIGTNGPNTLRGTPYADVLDGRGGADRLYGLAGNDRLLGSLGNDRLLGGAGVDRLLGGPGNDVLDGGGGRDVLEGGGGIDVLQARDAARDTIRCGAGRDSVLADRADVVARDCEIVRRR